MKKYKNKIIVDTHINYVSRKDKEGEKRENE